MSSNVVFASILCFGTIITRFIPFIFEKRLKKFSEYELLNNLLITILIGYLVFKSLTNFSTNTELLINLLSALFVTVFYKFSKSVSISIGLGTALFVVLVNYVKL